MSIVRHMTENFKPRLVNLNDDELVDWISEPVFNFPEEIDGLMMLQALGDELRQARKQVEHCMRYLTSAARAAHEAGATPQAIINESGLARQTVYNMIGE